MEEKKMASEKWGELANAGFQLLPDILLKKQKDLGLSSVDMMVLINICMHWWYEDKKPFPHTQRIADHMGVEVRTVQRSLKNLISRELLRKEKVTVEGGQEQVVYNLSGLIKKLTPMALTDIGYRPRYKLNKEAVSEF